MDDEGDRSAHLSLVRPLLSDDLLAQHQTGLTDVHSMRANRQVWHLSLVFPTERAVQPLLLLGCFGAAAQGRDAFVADRNPSGSGNQAFFLQAEDGIRDGRVTGLQTCALPIYALRVGVRDGHDAAAGFMTRDGRGSR